MPKFTPTPKPDEIKNANAQAAAAASNSVPAIRLVVENLAARVLELEKEIARLKAQAQ